MAKYKTDERGRIYEPLTTRPVIEYDDDWETNHAAYLAFEMPLAIACGCLECADAIYDILEACRAQSATPAEPEAQK